MTAAEDLHPRKPRGATTASRAISVRKNQVGGQNRLDRAIANASRLRTRATRKTTLHCRVVFTLDPGARDVSWGLHFIHNPTRIGTTSIMVCVASPCRKAP